MKNAIVVLSMLISPLLHAGEPLVVVQDLGGVSALPYYQSLNLQPRHVDVRSPEIMVPQASATPVDEADMLPVRSSKLTPGTVTRRAIEAPGLRPFFVVGDEVNVWLPRWASASGIRWYWAPRAWARPDWPNSLSRRTSAVKVFLASMKW